MVYCPKLSLYTICRSKKIPQEAVWGYWVSATSLQEEPCCWLKDDWVCTYAGLHTIKTRAIYDSNVYKNTFKEHSLLLNDLILNPTLLRKKTKTMTNLQIYIINS